jgi:hypothetical protein
MSNTVGLAKFLPFVGVFNDPDTQKGLGVNENIDVGPRSSMLNVHGHPTAGDLEMSCLMKAP